jgi:hypothetical protein
MKLRAAFACLLAAALGGAVPSSAFGIERIDAAFLAEYSSPSYTIDQGELVTFGNSDSFLAHGIASDTSGLFSAPVIGPGQVRLLRGAPFLTTGGPYPFHCPVHAGMTAELNVSASGAPLPPDATPPTATIKVKSASALKLAAKRKLRIVVNPSEAVDAVIKAGAGGALLGRIERTWVASGARALTIGVSREAAKAMRDDAAQGSVPLRVKITLSDVAGNSTTVKRSRALAGAPKRKAKAKGKRAGSATSRAQRAR